MEKKLDLRIQKTYLALEEAFTKLLEQKPFESITTNELCDTAMIRRTTFYKHFEDKYDYFSFYISNLINRSRNNTPIELLKEDPVKYTELRLKEHLAFMKEHKKLVRNLNNSTTTTFFLLSIQKQIDNEIRTILKETGDYEPSPKLDFTLYLYTGALLSSMGWLIDHPDTFSEKEIATILYSGGTSGAPKGVELTNLNVNALAMQSFEAVANLREKDKVLAIMPIFHGFGLGVCIHTVQYFGGTSILLPQFSAKTFDKLIKKYEPNVLVGVPTLYEALLKNKNMNNYEMPFLKCAISGGDSLSIELKRKIDNFFNNNIHIFK